MQKCFRLRKDSIEEIKLINLLKEIGIMEIDYEKLRSDLKDYYGTAMFQGFPTAMFEISAIEKADGEELICIATKLGFDLERYCR